MSSKIGRRHCSVKVPIFVCFVTFWQSYYMLQMHGYESCFYCAVFNFIVSPVFQYLSIKTTFKGKQFHQLIKLRIKGGNVEIEWKKTNVLYTHIK